MTLYGRLYPLQTGHIMRILPPLNSHRMRITFPVKGISDDRSRVNSGISPGTVGARNVGT